MMMFGKMYSKKRGQHLRQIFLQDG
uniref:Uncharacterized protein n=1 Tax=Rhizophora mucronata TaxID=61149 RepID=A0A2P2NPB5_RHIMU